MITDDPALPTKHKIGSDEKVELMVRRYELGLPLFVVGDATDCTTKFKHGGRNGPLGIFGDKPQRSERVKEPTRLSLPYGRR